MQTTGSFKIRGIIWFLHQLSKVNGGKDGILTLSSGNFGKALAYCCQKQAIKTTIAMPITAPLCKELAIKRYGSNVVRVKSSNILESAETIAKKEGKLLLNGSEETSLIAGYGSCGLEILEEIIPDVVVVGIGWGGLAAAIGATMKLNGHDNTRIYGVEPETGNTMQKSFKEGKAVTMPNAESIATGLATSFTSEKNYKLCKSYLDDVVTVSDRELVLATRKLFEHGLVVEVSGAASYAALLFNKIPDLRGNVVAIVTGGNTTPDDLMILFKLADENQI